MSRPQQHSQGTNQRPRNSRRKRQRDGITTTSNNKRARRGEQVCEKRREEGYSGFLTESDLLQSMSSFSQALSRTGQLSGICLLSSTKESPPSIQPQQIVLTPQRNVHPPTTSTKTQHSPDSLQNETNDPLSSSSASPSSPLSSTPSLTSSTSTPTSTSTTSTSSTSPTSTLTSTSSLSSPTSLVTTQEEGRSEDCPIVLEEDSIREERDHQSQIQFSSSSSSSSSEISIVLPTDAPEDDEFKKMVIEFSSESNTGFNVLSELVGVSERQEETQTQKTQNEGKESQNTEENSSPKKQKIIFGTCNRCQTDVSPEWRRGLNGVKNLCNRCGLRSKRIEKQRGQKVWKWDFAPLSFKTNSQFFQDTLPKLQFSEKGEEEEEEEKEP